MRAGLLAVHRKSLPAGGECMAFPLNGALLSKSPIGS